MTSCTDGNCIFCAAQNRDGKYVTACEPCRGGNGVGLAGMKTSNGSIAPKVKRPALKMVDLTDTSKFCACSDRNCLLCSNKAVNEKKDTADEHVQRVQIDRKQDSPANDNLGGLRRFRIDRKQSDSASDSVADSRPFQVYRRKLDLPEIDGTTPSQRFQIDRSQADSAAKGVVAGFRPIQVDRKQLDSKVSDGVDRTTSDATANVAAVSLVPTTKGFATEGKRFCVDKTCALCSSHVEDGKNVPACGGYLRTNAVANDAAPLSLSARVRHSSAGNFNSKAKPLAIDKYFRLVNTLDRSDAAPTSPSALCYTEIDIKDPNSSSQPPHDDRSTYLGYSTDIVSSVNSLLIRNSFGLRNGHGHGDGKVNGNGYDGASDYSGGTTATRSRADSKNGAEWQLDRSNDVSFGFTHGNGALSFAETKRFIREVDLSEAELAILLRRHASKLPGVIGRLEQMDVDGTGLIDGFEKLPTNTEQELAFRKMLAEIQAREARRRNTVNTADVGTQFDSEIFKSFVSARVKERVDQLENERKTLLVLQSRNAFAQHDAGLFDQFLNSALNSKIETLYSNSKDNDNDPTRKRARELVLQQLERERQQRAVHQSVQYDYRTRVDKSEHGAEWSPLRSTGTQLNLSELDVPVDDLEALLKKQRKEAMRVLASLGARNHDSRELGTQLSLSELDLPLEELQALLKKKRVEAMRILAETGLKDRACCEASVQVVTDELDIANDELETLLKKHRKEAMRILAQQGLREHASREVGLQLSLGELELTDDMIQDLLINNRPRIQRLFARMGTAHGLSREASVQINEGELEFSTDQLEALLKKNRPEVQRRLAALIRTDHACRDVGQQLSMNELDLPAEMLEKLLRSNRTDARRLLAKQGLEDRASLEVGVQPDPKLLDFSPEQLEELLQKHLPNKEKLHKLLNGMKANNNGSQYESERFTQTDFDFESLSPEELQKVLRKYKGQVRDFAKLLQEEGGLLVDACIGPDDSPQETQTHTNNEQGETSGYDQRQLQDIEDSFKHNWCRMEDPSTSKREEDDLDKQRIICTEKATTTHVHLEHTLYGKLNDRIVVQESSVDGHTDVQVKHENIPDEHQMSESKGVVTMVTRHREKDSLTATQKISAHLPVNSLIWLNSIAPFFDYHHPIDPAAVSLDEE